MTKVELKKLILECIEESNDVDATDDVYYSNLNELDEYFHDERLEDLFDRNPLCKSKISDAIGNVLTVIKQYI